MIYQLPNTVRTKYFQPAEVDLPEGGFPRHMGFDFNPLSPMDVQELTRPIRSDTLFYAMTGNFTNPSTAAVNVFTQVFHIHNGRQIPMFSKPAPMTNAWGSGQRPMVVKPTWFVPAGDSIMMEVRSTDRLNNLNVETCLIGTTINRNMLSRLQKIVLDDKAKFLETLEPDNQDTFGDRPPEGARPLVLTSTKWFDFPPPGAAAVPIFTYIVPTGQRSRIFEHALVTTEGGLVDMSGNVIWRFLVDGWPLKGLGTQIAQIGSFQTPDKVVIWLKENQQFQVTVEVPNGAQVQNGKTAYRINGWSAAANLKNTGSLQ